MDAAWTLPAPSFTYCCCFLAISSFNGVKFGSTGTAGGGGGCCCCCCIICAEGGAITSMVAAGSKEILEVLVYAEAETPVAPCGGCRQKLAEFAGPEVKVSLAGPEGIRAVMTMADLLPASFSLK